MAVAGVVPATALKNPPQAELILRIKIQNQSLGIFQPGQLGSNRLGRFGIGPKFRLGGLRFESLYVPLYLSGVKDDPSLR